MVVCCVIIGGVLTILFIATCLFGGYNGSKQDGYIVGICGIVGIVALLLTLLFR